MEQKQLSLCIMTKSDASLSPNCLKDMKEIADEILVADLGSDDCTRQLVRQSGAKVYQPKWEDDFSKIKNFCMDHATGQWVLFLQADEVISHDQLKELKFLLQNPNAEAYLFNVTNIQKDPLISSPAQLVRLIRNRPNYRFRYRSFEYIPDEELYALQASGLQITHAGEKPAECLLEERIRLLPIDLKEHPQDGYVWYLQGIAFLNQKKYEESAASFKRALQSFGGGYLYVPHLYKCLGICLLSLGRSAEAEQILSEGFKLFPFYNDLLILRAKLYNQLGRKTEASMDLEICLALRKGVNVCVPQPEMDVSIIENMLKKIRTGLN